MKSSLQWLSNKRVADEISPEAPVVWSGAHGGEVRDLGKHPSWFSARREGARVFGCEPGSSLVVWPAAGPIPVGVVLLRYPDVEQAQVPVPPSFRHVSFPPKRRRRRGNGRKQSPQDL